MRQPHKAKAALARAEQETDELTRSIWLAKAVDFAISDRAVLVGGTAVNLHTQQYQPTDVDMCAYLDEEDRQALADLGIDHLQGDHFTHTFSDGPMLIEFPDTRVDGDVMEVDLDGDEPLTVITRESLVVDRIEQATDKGVTFVEAVRLCFALIEDVNWSQVETEIRKRDKLAPRLKLMQTYEQVLSEVRTRRENVWTQS